MRALALACALACLLSAPPSAARKSKKAKARSSAARRPAQGQPSVQAALMALQGGPLGMPQFRGALEGREIITPEEHAFIEGMQMQKSTGEWVTLLLLATNQSRASADADAVARTLINTGAAVDKPQEKVTGTLLAAPPLTNHAGSLRAAAGCAGPGKTAFLEACYLNRLHLADLMLARRGSLAADAAARTPKGQWAVHLPFKHWATIATQLAKDLLLRGAAAERGETPDTTRWMRDMKTLPRLSEWTERAPGLADTLAAAGGQVGEGVTALVTAETTAAATAAFYEPFVRKILRRCRALDGRCNLDERLDVSGGWFQLNTVSFPNDPCRALDYAPPIPPQFPIRGGLGHYRSSRRCSDQPQQSSRAHRSAAA